MASKQILIIEDEPEIAALHKTNLQRANFDAEIAGDGKSAFSSIKKTKPILILLDLMLPDISGLDICKKLKAQSETSDIPIIIVSALGDESDIVTGLELGATDYVTKPFSPKVLLARVRAVLRREESKSTNDIISLFGGDLVIDNDRHRVVCDGNVPHLTTTEYGILYYLARRPGFVRTREQITQSIHGESSGFPTRTIDVHVTSLRKKLGTLASVVETVRGVGYRLNEVDNPCE